MINANLIKEGEVFAERWSKTEYLQGIESKWIRSCLAIILENQRLMNECATDVDDNAKIIRSKLVQLVASVYPKLLIWKLVSVQPMLGPTGLVYHTCYRKKDEIWNLHVESQDIIALTRQLKRKVCVDFGPKDISFDLIKEFDTEVINDLWNNCGLLGCVNLNAYTKDKAVRLRESLEILLNDSSRKNFDTKPNWAVVNNDIYDKFRTAFEGWTNLSVYPHNAIKGIIVGYKGESYMQSGYVISPYVPFTSTPMIAGDERYGLMTRYGKKLLPNGSNYYSKLTVLDKELNGE